MKKESTRKDVAKLAGVSVATVSYVLNNDSKAISKDTRERVFSAARSLDYHPNRIARSLKTGTYQSIGILVTTLGQHGLPSLVDAALRRADEFGYTVQMGVFGDRAGVTVQRVEAALAKLAVDGVLIETPNPFHVTEWDRIIGENQPIVFLGTQAGASGQDLAGPDAYGAGKLAIEFLLLQGCKDICLVDEPRTSIDMPSVLDGCKAILEDRSYADVKLTHLVLGWVTRASREAELSSRIRTDSPPDGWIMATDETAQIVETVLVRADKPMPPRRIIIAGANECVSREEDTVRIRFDLEEIGRSAVELLVSRLRGAQEKSRHVLVPGELIIK